MIAIVLLAQSGLAQSGGFLPVYYRPRSISSGANAFMNFMTDISSINSPQYCTNLFTFKNSWRPKTQKSEVDAEELQRDALPTHWWPCQTHRRLFFPTQGEGDNHVGRFHGGVAGEQPNGFNNQMGGMETRLMGLMLMYFVDG